MKLAIISLLSLIITNFSYAGSINCKGGEGSIYEHEFSHNLPGGALGLATIDFSLIDIDSSFPVGSYFSIAFNNGESIDYLFQYENDGSEDSMIQSLILISSELLNSTGFSALVDIVLTNGETIITESSCEFIE